MTYQILVQSKQNNLFAASVLGIPDCVAQGKTEEEALLNAKERLRLQLAEGKVYTVEIENGQPKFEENPWLKVIGSGENDPHWEQFQEHITTYRHELDAEEATEILETKAAQ